MHRWNGLWTRILHIGNISHRPGARVATRKCWGVDFAGRAKRLLHHVAFAVATFQKRTRVQSTAEVVDVGGASGSCTVAENVNGGIGRDTNRFARCICRVSKKTWGICRVIDRIPIHFNNEMCSWIYLQDLGVIDLENRKQGYTSLTTQLVSQDPDNQYSIHSVAQQLNWWDSNLNLNSNVYDLRGEWKPYYYSLKQFNNINPHTWWYIRTPTAEIHI